MPLDIVLFRAEGNPDSIRKSQAARGAPVEAVDEIIAKDEKWRCGRYRTLVCMQPGLSVTVSLTISKELDEPS